MATDFKVCFWSGAVSFGEDFIVEKNNVVTYIVQFAVKLSSEYVV